METLTDAEIEKHVRTRLEQGGFSSVDVKEAEALLRIITGLRKESTALQQVLNQQNPQVVNSSGVDKEAPKSRIRGEDAVRGAKEEGITVSEFLKKHDLQTIAWWDGKCTECGGDGPYRIPKNKKYKYDEVCAWCRAMIPPVERADHPKAEDGGPK